MLEARLVEAQIFRKVVDAIKELVNEANFDCNASGITVQAMDTTHVALATLLLRAEGFDTYRCDRNIPLGINLTSLTKILKSANNNDVLTLRAEDSGDAVGLLFNSPSKISFLAFRHFLPFFVSGACLFLLLTSLFLYEASSCAFT